VIFPIRKPMFFAALEKEMGDADSVNMIRFLRAVRG